MKYNKIKSTIKNYLIKKLQRRLFADRFIDKIYVKINEMIKVEPVTGEGFKPSMADISYTLDALLKLAESGDQDAQELYQQACSHLWNLEDIWKITLNWSEFKSKKEAKEKAEVANLEAIK